MLTIYLAVAAGMAVLLFLARKENPVSDEPVSALLRPVRKAAVCLYRFIQRVSNKRKHGNTVFPGSELVRKDFSILDPSRKAGRRTILYYIDKIQKLLLFIIAADFLALAAWYMARESLLISDDGVVSRPNYGEDALELTATAQDAEEQDVEYGEFTIEIGARQYTEEETEALAEDLLLRLPKLILGKNTSLLHVSDDLNLISEAEGYPFDISWESSRYEWVRSDGTVHEELIAEGNTAEVELTAILTYLSWTYEETYQIVIYPQELTQEEQWSAVIQEALVSSDEETASEDSYYLPNEAGTLRLQWSENVEDSSALLFGLVLAAGLVVFLMSDRDLHSRLEQRDRQMALDYPQIVSKLVLFLGAGMSVRNAFLRLGESYTEDCRKGGEKHYVYEEILLVCRELDSGISESTAYANFGSRCRSRQYTKLCSLLDQNLKKGNSALLQALQEEADLAFEERKNLARQMGEEAGTKLLLPMILMLAVTLVMIMIPAYLSFSI